MCGAGEPQKTDFFFQWNAVRTSFHAKLFSFFVIDFGIFFHRFRSPLGHMLCVSILLEEEGEPAMCLVIFALGLVLHVARFYKIMAEEICGKCTHLQDFSDLKLNLCIDKAVYQFKLLE